MNAAEAFAHQFLYKTRNPSCLEVEISNKATTAESEITELAKQKWRKMRREQKESAIQNPEEEELRAGND